MDVDAYTDDLTKESIEAIKEIEGVVDKASGLEDEIIPVRDEVFMILSNLSKGDQVGASRAVIELFDDQTGKEIDEAVEAANQIAAEAVDVRGEIADVFDLAVKGIRAGEDEAEQYLEDLQSIFSSDRG